LSILKIPTAKAFEIATPGDGLIIIFRGMQSFTFKAVITIIVSGLVGAAWLGVKVMLGR
jgi:hypothetical protein